MTEERAPYGDQIVTNAMLHAERLDRIEQLERELAAARKDAERWRNCRTLDATSVMRMVSGEG